jgi:transcriptional regulator with XRE-family HTH domain
MADEEQTGLAYESAAAGGVGSQLRAARKAAGLTIDQVAQETRISRRNIEAIERGAFAELPARPYAIGFAKSYAKVVGLDQADVSAMVTAELDAQETHPPLRQPVFEPGDPARAPSPRLVVVSLVAVVLLLAGLFFAARQMFTPAAELPSLVAQQEAQRAAAAQARASGEPAQRSATAQAPAGPVVFTALEEGIWVKFYDESGVDLMQRFMAEGERYTVPEDARGPQLWTGRPDALAISIGGQEVPRLAERVMIMRDVPVTAEALLARPTPGTAASAAGASTPAPTAGTGARAAPQGT